MAETFYGPWSVYIRKVKIPVPNFYSPVRFIIIGSAASDGVHAAVTQSQELTVSGEAWTIAMEYGAADSTWSPMEMHRSAAYTIEEALVVYLIPRPPENVFTNAELVCRSRNPAHSPMHPILTYDFTISDEAMKRRRPRPTDRDGVRRPGAHR